MARLHELLAVMGDTTAAASTIISEGIVTFNKRADHFKGQARSITFLDDSRSAEDSTDSKELVSTVPEKISYVNQAVGRNWDALLQLEEANTRAKADLVYDGQVLMKDVPATFLLGMESRLKAYRAFVLAAPTLEPSIKWEEDKAAGEGVFRSPALVSFKTEKKPRSTVLYEATKEHPAQIREWYEDIPSARIETTHKSGMISPNRKSAILRNTDKMIAAVKKARQRANGADVNGDLKISQAIFDTILA
jgi:hypothetical protein